MRCLMRLIDWIARWCVDDEPLFTSDPLLAQEADRAALIRSDPEPPTSQGARPTWHRAYLLSKREP